MAYLFRLALCIKAINEIPIKKMGLNTAIQQQLVYKNKKLARLYAKLFENENSFSHFEPKS
jgi:hypothetical protein